MRHIRAFVVAVAQRAVSVYVTGIYWRSHGIAAAIWRERQKEATLI